MPTTRAQVTNTEYHALHRQLMVDAAFRILGKQKRKRHQIEYVDLGPIEEISVGAESVLLRVRRPHNQYGDFTMRAREKPSVIRKPTELEVVVYGGLPPQDPSRRLSRWYLYAHGAPDDLLPDNPSLTKVVMMRLDVFREGVKPLMDRGVLPGGWMPGGGRKFEFQDFPGLVYFWETVDTEGLFPGSTGGYVKDPREETSLPPKYLAPNPPFHERPNTNDHQLSLNDWWD